MSPAPRVSKSTSRSAPPSREVVAVGLLLGLIVAALLAVTAAAFYAQAGVRAYVGGEALYSKSQKDAVYHLLRYAQTRDEREYRAFETTIAVPLADGRARRELLREGADLARAGRELEAGGNHPDDVGPMIRLFRRAGWVPEMEEAIGIWTRGDERVERLEAIGRELHAELGAGGARPARAAELLAQVDRVNAELTELEKRFSSTLGRGARRIAAQALLAVTGSGLALAALGIGMSTRLLRRVRREEARFRSIIEHGHDAVGILDREGTIRYHSPALQRVFGYDSLVGRNALEFVHAEDLEAARAGLLRAAAPGGEPASFTVRVRQADGAYRILEVLGGSLAELEGGGSIVFHSRDVTERQLLEGRLAEAQRLESLGRLAGGVAHDFNNLLTVILGSAADASEEVAAGSAARERIGEITGAAERAASLTRQLLSFARRQIVNPQHFDLAERLRTAAPVLRRLAGPEVEFRLETDANPAWVRADPGQIEQMAVNLVANARDAMPGGGALRVSVSRVSIAPAEASPDTGHLSGTLVRMTVSDTGVAMDEETRRRAFEPFFTTKPGERGIGLGLAVCHGIVKQCGGHIGFESRPGEGTRFTVLLPYARAGLDKAEAPPLQRGSETVLLVEDDPAVRRVAATALRRNGYRVLEAEDGESAERAFAAEGGAVDLLLTDVEMPGGGGRSLAERIVARKPGLAVLFVSGHTEDTALRQEIQRSALPFLAKPFTPDELARRVRAVLDAS